MVSAFHLGKKLIQSTVEHRRKTARASGAPACCASLKDRGRLQPMLAAQPFDLQTALDSEGESVAWWDVLKIIARWHMNCDVFAERLFRVNRAFEYCWRLAARTTEIDVAALQRRCPLTRVKAVATLKTRQQLKLSFSTRFFYVAPVAVAPSVSVPAATRMCPATPRQGYLRTVVFEGAADVTDFPSDVSS